MRNAKDCLALNASLENGISGWMNNITEQEKKLTDLFLEDPNSFSGLFLGEGKLVNCPLLVSRIQRIVVKYGIQSLNIINELLWGIHEDGKNSPIEFTRARDLTERILKTKGAKQ